MHTSASYDKAADARGVCKDHAKRMRTSDAVTRPAPGVATVGGRGDAEARGDQPAAGIRSRCDDPVSAVREQLIGRKVCPPSGLGVDDCPVSGLPRVPAVVRDVQGAVGVRDDEEGARAPRRHGIDRHVGAKGRRRGDVRPIPLVWGGPRSVARRCRRKQVRTVASAAVQGSRAPDPSPPVTTSTRLDPQSCCTLTASAPT